MTVLAVRPRPTTLAPLAPLVKLPIPTRTYTQASVFQVILRTFGTDRFGNTRTGTKFTTDLKVITTAAGELTFQVTLLDAGSGRKGNASFSAQILTTLDAQYDAQAGMIIREVQTAIWDALESELPDSSAKVEVTYCSLDKTKPPTLGLMIFMLGDIRFEEAAA